MADYVSILSRAIEGLSENSPSTREQVYQKARTAIDRKLRAIDPPLSEDAITNQLSALEASIGEVEASHLAAAAEPIAKISTDPGKPETAPVKAVEQDVSAPVGDGATQAAEPISDNPETAETAVRKVETTADVAGDTVVGPEPAMVESPVLDAPVVEAPAAKAPEFDTAKVSAPDRAISADVGGAVEAPAIEPPSVSKSAIDPTPPFISELDDDPVAPVAPVAERNPAVRPTERPVERPVSRPLAGNDVPQPITQPRRMEPHLERNVVLPVKKSSGGKLIGTLAVLAILGGGAAGAYVFREDVAKVGGQMMEAVEGLLGSTSNQMADKPAETAKPSEPAVANTEQPAKDTSRLDSSGKSTTSEPIDITPEQPVAPAVVEQPAPTEETPATVEVAEASQTNQGDVNSSTEQPQAAENTSGTSETPAPQVAVLTGEKAYLYEEAVGETGANRDEGSMSWSLVNEPPEEGSPPEPVIKGMLEIPGRGLSLNLSIKRNVDSALPASHVIELLFGAPPEFSGGNIDQLSRFVMKSTEQARGESLVGVPARIDAGYFLIALNNLDQAQQTNLNLLLSSSWIDIPVTYVTGRRGLITFDKGVTGTEIFKQALDDWKNR